MATCIVTPHIPTRARTDAPSIRALSRGRSKVQRAPPVVLTGTGSRARHRFTTISVRWFCTCPVFRARCVCAHQKHCRIV